MEKKGKILDAANGSCLRRTNSNCDIWRVGKCDRGARSIEHKDVIDKALHYLAPQFSAQYML